MTLPNLDDLQRRYATACELKNPVDRDKIESAMLEWARGIGAPAETKITFVSRAARAASAASAARAAWDAMAARDARAASAAWDAWDARAARDAMAASAARAASAASAAWDASWISITAIGAVSLGDDKTARIWLPVLSAFENGAFAFWITDAEIFVSTTPAAVLVDSARRLHCETGPAFVWLDDVRDYYWRGVKVPDHWIMQRDDLTAAEIFKEQNAETRRAGCEIIGWERVLSGIDATLIDDDGDPFIGTLYEGQIPGANRCGFLKVECGTHRTFVIPVAPGMKSAIEAQAWIQNVPKSKWTRPEVRG